MLLRSGIEKCDLSGFSWGHRSIQAWWCIGTNKGQTNRLNHTKAYRSLPFFYITLLDSVLFVLCSYAYTQSVYCFHNNLVCCPVMGRTVSITIDWVYLYHSHFLYASIYLPLLSIYTILFVYVIILPRCPTRILQVMFGVEPNMNADGNVWRNARSNVWRSTQQECYK